MLWVAVLVEYLVIGAVFAGNRYRVESNHPDGAAILARQPHRTWFVVVYLTVTALAWPVALVWLVNLQRKRREQDRVQG